VTGVTPKRKIGNPPIPSTDGAQNHHGAGDAGHDEEGDAYRRDPPENRRAAPDDAGLDGMGDIGDGNHGPYLLLAAGACPGGADEREAMSFPLENTLGGQCVLSVSESCRIV